MKVAVLLAGVADPRHPLTLRSSRPPEIRRDNPLVFSPFDEAALELALKIRDGRRDTAITAIVAGGAESDALVRKAAAHRLDSVARLESEALAIWDVGATAHGLAEALRGLATRPDLVLIGREFGDFDDGALAPCLAAALGWPLFDLAQFARWEGDELILVRDGRSAEERLGLRPPWVASVTNDRRNRLRHPLMKNVMEARRRGFDVLTVAPVVPSATLKAVAPARERTRREPCRFLTGSVENQVAELAAYLQPWRALR